MSSRTHRAVVTVAPRAPLEILEVPTVEPVGDEILIRTEWTASTPLDLHQADGGILVKHPHILGDGVAGTVLEVGPDVKNLKVGDEVFGFQWRERKERGHQERITAPEWLFGKIPEGFTKQQVVTIPNNFVTAFHTLSKDMSLPLPWPKPQGYVPKKSTDPILIWGAASSVGQYVLQVLRYYGYTTLIVTASPSQHDHLRKMGALKCFNYRDANVVYEILDAYPTIPHILDCIGSVQGTLEPIAKIAKKGTRIAIMLPVIVKAATEAEAPEYTFDTESHVKWAEGTEPRGVRTHFYLENKEFKEKLQSEIMPTMLKDGTVQPNRYQIVEGKSLVERAENALTILRSGTISGERLVWRISEPEA